MNNIILVPKGFKKFLCKNYFSFEYKFMEINDLYDLVFGKVFFGNLANNFPINIQLEMYDFARFVSQEYDDKILQQLYTINQSLELSLIDNLNITALNINDQFLQEHNDWHDISLAPKNKCGYQFMNIRDEIIYIFEQISTLLDEGISLDDITIAYTDSIYLQYLKYYANFYQIPIIDSYKKTLSSCPEFKTFISCYRDIGLENAIQQIDNIDVKECIIKIINKTKGLDSNTLYEFILHESRNTLIGNQELTNGIHICNLATMEINEHNFIVGCMEGLFPNLTIKESILSDDQLKMCNINTSKELVKNIELRTNLILNLDNVIFTCCTSDDVNYYQPSRLLDIVKIENVFAAHSLNLAKFLQVENNKQYDYELLNRQKYDHQCNELLPVTTQIQISFSSLDKYAKCPFKFYLENILKLRKYTSITTLKGKIVHHICEQAIKELTYVETDFEVFLDEYLKAHPDQLEDEIDTHYIINDVKKMFTHIHVTLMPIIDAINEGKIKEVYCEESMESTIGLKTTLKGIADLMILENDCINIIDYKQKKPNNLSINHNLFEYGMDLQNAIYLLLYAKKNDNVDVNYRSLQIAIYKKNVEYIDDYKKYQELSDYRDIYEISYSGFSSNDKNLAPYLDLSMLTEELEIIIQSMVDSIINGNFPITPAIQLETKKNGIKKFNNCEYCLYHDICHRDNHDFLYGEKQWKNYRFTKPN